MTMSPCKSDPEDDYFDLEIQQELERIDLDEEDKTDEEEPINLYNDNEEDTLETISDAMQSYLKRIQDQSRQFELELEECDELIQPKPSETDNGLIPQADDLELLQEAAAEHGLDPGTYKQQVLHDLEKEDEVEFNFEEEDLISNHGDGGGAGGDGQVRALMTEVTPELHESTSPGEEGDSYNQGETSVNSETGMIVLADPSLQFLEFLREQWIVTNEKQKQRYALQKEKTAEIVMKACKEQEVREEQRQRKLQEMENEEKDLESKLKIQTEKINAELEQKKKIMELEWSLMEKTMEDLERKNIQEREELTRQQTEALEKLERQKREAAVKLQSTFRGYRMRRIHGAAVKTKMEEGRKKMEQKRIQQKEVELKKFQEEQKAEELKRKEERKVQEELEIERKAMEAKKMEEERKAMEAKKMEEERKATEAKKMEEERKATEAKKLEEERKATEAKKMEEERKAMEAKKMEEERKATEAKKMEEERKATEAKKLEEERKATEAKKMEEERKATEAKKMEEERKAMEAKKLEEERKATEAKKLEEERKATEAKKMEEERKALEAEKKKEEERKTLEAEKKKEEERKALEAEKKEDGERRLLVDKKKEDKRAMEIKNQEEKLITASLSDDMEKKRRAWMSECSPWSKVSTEPWKRQQTASMKPVRRPSSAKSLPPLDKTVILTSGQCNSLQQVTTVQLSDLPGSSLSTFVHCVNLRYLDMRNCALKAVDGLKDCRNLLYVNFQNNELQYVNLNDLELLEYVNLSSNQLSIVHGLEGCTNLRWLDMSHNKLIKIGWLCGLRQLHTLSLSHNKLISTQGLGAVPTLQYLNLSHNHVQVLEDIDNLCLLQTLILTGNTILQVPCLVNQVLLQELLLEDNSITSLGGLNSSWLPFLRKLNLAQNNLCDLGDVKYLLLLNDLDISHNQLLDGVEMVNSLKQCNYLSRVCVKGNPGSMEFRSAAVDCLPSLITIDGESIRDTKITITPSCSFEVMCLNQCKKMDELKEHLHHHSLCSDSEGISLEGIYNAYSRYCKMTFDLAVESRYAHEYGDVTVTWPSAPAAPKPIGRPHSGRARVKTAEKRKEESSNRSDPYEESTNVVHMTPDIASQFSQHLQPNGENIRVNVISSSQVNIRSNGNDLLETAQIDMNDETMNISRELVNDGAVIAKVNWTPLDEAATLIQAYWRGYSLRTRLLQALEYAHMSEEEEEDFQEIDLAHFNFDMAGIDGDWKPPPTPNIPSSHPVLGKPPSGRPGSESATPHPPVFPKQAWRNLTSPLTNRSLAGDGQPRPPSSTHTGTDTHRTGLSKKEEMISEEWGFKDNKTAMLMVQRAKKMKYNADHRKKIRKLDPKQKLALFKKLSESTHLMRPVQTLPRKTLPRKEYFQARAKEVEEKEREKRVEVATKASRTFEWLHNQVGEFSSVGMQEHMVRSESETSLPRLGSDITMGRRVQLVGSHVPMEIESVTSVEESARNRSYSMDDSSSNIGEKTVPLQFPPLKTNSAPSSKTRERMSWRTRKKSTDIGWGGGRKRSKEY